MKDNIDFTRFMALIVLRLLVALPTPIVMPLVARFRKGVK